MESSRSSMAAYEELAAWKTTFSAPCYYSQVDAYIRFLEINTNYSYFRIGKTFAADFSSRVTSVAKDCIEPLITKPVKQLLDKAIRKGMKKVVLIIKSEYNYCMSLVRRDAHRRDYKRREESPPPGSDKILNTVAELGKSVAAMKDFYDEACKKREEKTRRKLEMKEAKEREATEREKAEQKARKTLEKRRWEAELEAERRAKLQKDTDIHVAIRLSEMEENFFAKMMVHIHYPRRWSTAELGVTWNRKDRLNREVIRWLQSLDLSHSVKNIRREAANGFLVAEILSRYYPQDILLHSFDTGAAMVRRMNNWAQLVRFFSRAGWTISLKMINGTMNAHAGSAVALIETLYVILTKRK
ncbi:hypothetical protein CBR_g36312 [Chara braunii]|uniref:CH-like domain-containing protein n=1 Tax=Chara braunii TaxID=69332 RepID=A0A388LKJ9_CHABU|nr:hypothetical protein CBR_g36312 [Chara braunii]|eukprot:GBG82781.1 hypothetical protein CBR_g36312 [Chara braunii]